MGCEEKTKAAGRRCLIAHLHHSQHSSFQNYRWSWICLDHNVWRSAANKRITTSRFFFFFSKTLSSRSQGNLKCATCHALIFFHKCLNSCRFSFPVPSVWKWFRYGKMTSIACYVILKVNMENERSNLLILFQSLD